MFLNYKVIKIFKIFFFSKKKFSKPKNVDILVFNTEKNIFENFIKDKNLNLHYLRSDFKEINLLLIFKIIFSVDFFKIKLSSLYIIEYIKFIDPKLVITFSDNNIEFYKFKRYIPNIKFSFVQNGIRTARFDVFEKFNENETYEVDYMFVFNESIGKEYNKYIKGEYIVTGSLKNNFVELSDHKYDNNIVYISQYTSEKYMHDVMLHSDIQGEITYEEFYKHENIILNYIKEFCIENNYNFKILGRPSNKNKIINEKFFYNNILDDFKWSYIESSGAYDNYYNIDKNLLLISSCCTLGYEALSRNKKIIFFPIRSKFFSDPFGWPHKLKDNGLFWTAENSKENFFNLINFTLNSEINDWINIIKPYKQNLMLHDQNNNIFNKKISQIVN